MQKHDIAAPGATQRGQHGVEPHAARGGIEIGIGRGLQTGRRDDRHMVRPGGIGNPYRRVGPGAAQQLGDQAQRARTARRLRGAKPRRIRLGAKGQPDHGGIKGRIAGKAEIGFRRLLVIEALFGGAHGAHDRRAAVRILVDADAEIDLVRARIVAEHADQGKDLVGGGRLQCLEHQYTS